MISNLTGIRGIAALWVFGLHYRGYFIGLFPEFSKLDFIFKNGGFGVDLFFCLSGFILGHVYFKEHIFQKRGIILKKYFYKRMARLYPVYFVTLMIASLFYILAFLTNHKFNHENPDNFTFAIFFQNLVGVQAWFGKNSINGPAWSVSAEFGAYLIFPLLLLILQRENISRMILSATLLIVSIIIFEISLRKSLIFNREVMQVITEFTMGLCAYVIVKDRDIPIKICKALRILLTCTLIIILFSIQEVLLLSSIIPIILLLIVALNYFHNFPGKGLSRTQFMNLGLWSYSLYMTHRLLQNVMSGISLPFYSGNFFLKLLEFSLLVALPIFVAFLTTKILEIPARRYLLGVWN